MIGKLPTGDHAEIIAQSLKKKGIIDSVRGQRKKKVQWKITNYETSKAGRLLEGKSIPSTIGTERPPKLRMSDKPRIQDNFQTQLVSFDREESSSMLVSGELFIRHFEYCIRSTMNSTPI